MGDRTTTYDVVTRYILEDKTSQAADRVARAQRNVATESEKAERSAAKLAREQARQARDADRAASHQARVHSARVREEERWYERRYRNEAKYTRDSEALAKRQERIAAKREADMRRQAELSARISERQSAMAGRTGSIVMAGALMGGAYAGGREVKKSLDYNSFMEQSQIQMAGLMAQAGSGDFTGNLGKSATLMKQMREDAAKTVGTTRDYVEMASMLIQPITMAKGTVEDVREMTKLSVVASKAMGIDAATSARDVDQAIRGVYRSVDQFTGKLLTPLGYGGEEGRKKFNALTMEQRFAEIRRAEGSQAIKAMAGAQEGTYEGVVSTSQSLWAEFSGNAGKPLFTAATQQLREWNKWLLDNDVKVKEIANDIGQRLVSAARDFKDAVAFAADHWKQILGTIVALKSAQNFIGLGSILSAGAGTAAAGSAAAAGGGAAAAGGLLGLGLKGGLALSVAGITAGALYVGGTLLTDYIDRRQSAAITGGATLGEATLGMFQESKLDQSRAKAMRQMLLSNGLASMSETGDYSINKAALAERVGGLEGRDRRAWADALGLHNPGSRNWYDSQEDPTVVAGAMAKAFADMLRDEFANGILDPAQAYPSLAFQNNFKLPGITKPQVNVTINRIEVTSEDPDRFAFLFERACSDVVRNGAGAFEAMRQG